MIIKGLMPFISQFNQVKSCINEYFDKILNLVIVTSNIYMTMKINGVLKFLMSPLYFTFNYLLI